MTESIESYSIQAAFALLKDQYETEGKTLPYNYFIDISTQLKSGKSVNNYRGLGFLFGYKSENLGENKNKIQFAIDNAPEKGTKTWETQFALIADYPNSGPIIEINGKKFYDYKADALTIAKKWCVENKRDVHIRECKVLKGFKPVTTSIFYKPSPGQQLATYVFID